jgi:hypothetical protein
VFREWGRVRRKATSSPDGPTDAGDVPMRSWQELRSLSRRCEAVLAGLPVPDPFDFDEFLDALGRQRGKPLRVWEWDMGADGGSPCGLYVGTELADHVFVAPAHSELQRRQTVVHELAHMVLGHRRKDGLSDVDLNRVLAGLSLSADRVRAVMARTSYTTPEEVEAGPRPEKWCIGRPPLDPSLTILCGNGGG